MKMACLSTSRGVVLACLPEKSEPPPKASVGGTKKAGVAGKKRPSLKKGGATAARPSASQIERAIGAGRYRDIDSRKEDEKKTEFDGLLPITTGQFETPVEESLRNAGRWLADKTSARSSGKGVLLFLFRYLLPVWALLLLLGIGIIKLPFSTPFLDDLFL